VSTPRTFSGRIYAADAKGFLSVGVNEHECEQIKGIMLDAPCRLTVYPEMATPLDLLTGPTPRMDAFDDRLVPNAVELWDKYQMALNQGRRIERELAACRLWMSREFDAARMGYIAAHLRDLETPLDVSKL
jgi:hypothetical protein